MLQWLLVFFAVAVSDSLWAIYVKSASKGRALKAASFSAFIVLIGGLVYVSYVNNKWLIIPAALGAFVGTIVTIRWQEQK